MLEIIAYVIGVLVVAVLAMLAYAATTPDAFRVHRSASIAAPAERIYPLIASLRSMSTWNPFVEPDPNIKLGYSGPEMGKGAVQTWTGNSKVGEGSIEITDAVPSSRVAMRLLMLKPLKADNTVEFTLQPASGGTTVTWAMSGRHSLMGKVMDTVYGTDRMCGPAFEKGLASLKAIAERKA